MAEELVSITEARTDMVDLDVSLRQAVLRDGHQVEHETNNGVCVRHERRSVISTEHSTCREITFAQMV